MSFLEDMAAVGGGTCKGFSWCTLICESIAQETLLQSKSAQGSLALFRGFPKVLFRGIMTDLLHPSCKVMGEGAGPAISIKQSCSGRPFFLKPLTD